MVDLRLLRIVTLTIVGLLNLPPDLGILLIVTSTPISPDSMRVNSRRRSESPSRPPYDYAPNGYGGGGPGPGPNSGPPAPLPPRGNPRDYPPPRNAREPPEPVGGYRRP